MPPRGRKRGLTRMDAALDAMAAFGFKRENARRCVKELLKVYGGDDGWRFIEDDSYMQLLEALLRDAEENQSKEKLIDDDGTATTSTIVSDTQQDERPENNAPADGATPSGVAAEPTPPELVRSSSGIQHEVGENAIPTEGNGKCWKDILPDQTSGHLEKETAKTALKTAEHPKAKAQCAITSAPSPSLTNTPSKSPTNSRPAPRRCLPCYGWIESDEETDDIIRLRPAPVVVVPKETPPAEPSKRREKRRTRWDEKPDDC